MLQHSFPLKRKVGPKGRKAGNTLVIMIIKNLKKKAITMSLLVAFWIGIFFFSGLITKNMAVSQFKIDNVLSFSYPPILIIGSIYVNEQHIESIAASSGIQKHEPLHFSTYISLKGRFVFEYPSIFTIVGKEFPGGEIKYHVDFKDTQGAIHGFVQVWNMPYSLKEFLDTSIANSTLTYKHFKSRELDIEDKRGYLWDYTVLGDADNTYYKGLEFFFKKNDSMYRIAYFVPEKEWDKAKENIFWSIVKSFQAY